jgi:hypothetical protein
MTMRNRFVLCAVVFLFALFLIAPDAAVAQCALCKANAESSVQGGASTAKGLNAGIMYLLLIPYTIAGALGYWWYTRNHVREDENV